MSDADHRQQFFAPIIDVERALAVRAVYLAVRDREILERYAGMRNLEVVFGDLGAQPGDRRPPERKLAR